MRSLISGPSLLKVARSAVMSKVATEFLPQDSARCCQSPEKFIVRSDAQMEAWRSEKSSFRPHWDATVSFSRAALLELYRTLASKGLIVLKKRIKSRCGMFFVWKSGKKAIRLLIYARGENACHRCPPRAFLGSGSAIGEMQISSAIGGFAKVEVALLEEGATMKKEESKERPPVDHAPSETDPGIRGEEDQKCIFGFFVQVA